MAFKKVSEYNAEKYDGLFRLPNDKDSADVVFLYQSINDVLVADVHYIKSNDYSGYVHCTGKGCPACAKGIRTQTKLFIPLYNMTDGEVQFFDRSMKFEPQLHSDVFARFPNPSEIVFTITRHGAAGDINTNYSIAAIGRNETLPFFDILKNHNVKFPDYYNNICRDVDAATMSKWLSDSGNSSDYSSDLPNYEVTPRAPVASFGQSPAQALDDVEASEDEPSDEELESAPNF